MVACPLYLPVRAIGVRMDRHKPKPAVLFGRGTMAILSSAVPVITAPPFTETGKEVAGGHLELAFCSLGVGVRTGEGTAEKLLTPRSSQKRPSSRDTCDPSEPRLSSHDWCLYTFELWHP